MHKASGKTRPEHLSSNNRSPYDFHEYLRNISNRVMTTRITRAAAAAAMGTPTSDIDTAVGVALPSSPAGNLSQSSPVLTKRSASGSKTATVQIAVDADAAVAAARPGSPVPPTTAAVLKPRSQAKQLLTKERNGMRASSNKENMQPDGVAGISAEAGNVVTDGRIERETPAITNGNQAPTEINVEHATAPTSVEAPATASAHELASTAKAPELPQTRPDRRASQAAAPKRQSMAPRTSRPSTADRHSSTAVIPHSKPRPMSMSFPTPPPPAKSSKPATRPTFALPGEAVAARLKAAKEARAAAAASAPAPVVKEESKRPAFKARPMPKMGPETAVVRQTAASRLREQLMHGGGDVPAAGRRASSVLERGPRASFSQASRRQNAVAPVAKTPRPSLPAATKGPRPSLGVGATAGTAKGREVYDRAAAGLAAQAQARRGKEEAAKKARAEAAERGRAASREWAEKQRLKARRSLAAAAAVSS